MKISKLLSIVLVLGLLALTAGCSNTPLATPPKAQDPAPAPAQALAPVPTPAPAPSSTPAVAPVSVALSTAAPSTSTPPSPKPTPSPASTPTPKPTPQTPSPAPTPTPAPVPVPVHVPAKFTLVEADGTVLVLDKTPQRIVVLSVNTAGVLANLGIMPVGMATTARAPEIIRDVPQVGTPQSPNMEQIKALNPDLVISNISFKAAQRTVFEQNGLKAYFISNQKYTDVLANLDMFGKAFGKETQAQALINGIRQRERAIVEPLKSKPQPTVMVIFGTAQSFLFSTQHSYVGEMVSILNGRNVTESMNVPPQAQNLPFSLENVVSLNPQIILRISHGNPEETKRLFDKEFAENPLWASISAVKNGRVHDLPFNLFFSNPGLTVIDALEELARIMYP